MQLSSYVIKLYNLLSATYHNYSFVYNISTKTYAAQFVNLDTNKQDKRKIISKT